MSTTLDIDLTKVELDLTLLEAILVYFDYGLDPGGCGRYVLLHDLQNAQPRQHELSRHTTPDVIAWVKRHLPAACQGSQERIDAWIAHGGYPGWNSADGISFRLNDNRIAALQRAKQACHYVPMEERQK